MSMYESAERINNDLKQIFESSYYKEFTIEQREWILNIMLRFGAVTKFRCRSNVAYDNFVNACLREIAIAKRVKEKENSEYEVLRAEMLPMTEYKDFLYKRGLEDIKTSFIEYVTWVKSGRKEPKIEIIKEV